MKNSKEKKIELTGINFKIGKKEISLTMEEAKKLKSLLDEMFNKGIVKEIHYDNSWWWNIHQPQINSPTFNPYEITCIDGSASVDGSKLNSFLNVNIIEEVSNDKVKIL